MLSFIEKLELEQALDVVRTLVTHGAATRVKLEWEQGQHPSVTYTPTVALEYVTVQFTVQDKVENE